MVCTVLADSRCEGVVGGLMIKSDEIMDDSPTNSFRR